MPGINKTGKPSTSDLYLGRGSVELAVINVLTGLPGDFRQVGNATAFALNVETEKLEHRNSRSGVRSVDREIILEQKVGVSLTMDETMNFDNLALFLSGQATGSVANPATASVTNALIATGAFKGRSYDLVNGSGARLMDTRGTLTVKSGTAAGGSGAAGTLVVSTSYEVDTTWGTVFIVPTGAFTEGHSIWISYVPAGNEVAVYQVNMLTKSKQSAFLRFKGINPGNSDQKILVDLHSVSLSADGDLSLIGEEFSELTVTGVAERNELGFPTAPTGRIYYHANA